MRSCRFLTEFAREHEHRPEVLLSFGFVPKVETKVGLIHWLIQDPGNAAVAAEQDFVKTLAASEPDVKRKLLVDLYKRIIDGVGDLGFPLSIHFEATYGMSRPAFDTFAEMLALLVSDALAFAAVQPSSTSTPAPVFAIPVRDSFAASVAARACCWKDRRAGASSVQPGTEADLRAVRFLTAAIEAGTVGWPDPVRGRVPVAVAVPAVDAARAAAIASESGCAAADVRVAVRPDSLAQDVAGWRRCGRHSGPSAALRCDAGGGWDVETAVAAIAGPRPRRRGPGVRRAAVPDAGAGRRGSQTCRGYASRWTSRSVTPPTRSLWISPKPPTLRLLTVGPLGGVRRTLRVAEHWECAVRGVLATGQQYRAGRRVGWRWPGTLPETALRLRVGHRDGAAGGSGVPGTLAGSRSTAICRWPRLPPGPDRERLRQFEVADSARVAWWRQRLAAVQQLL